MLALAIERSRYTIYMMAAFAIPILIYGMGMAFCLKAGFIPSL